MTDVQAEAPKGKSIVDPKYRKSLKDNRDWLANFLAEQATKTKQVKKFLPNPENPDEKVATTETRPDGVDVDKLFALAKANNIDVSKYASQAGTHGFPGRFRMTLRNMLQSAVKQRHVIFNTGGTEIPAPKEWLELKGAPAEPTHTPAGVKIAKPKAEPAAAPAETGGETTAGASEQ